jgi:hypothetical protein
MLKKNLKSLYFSYDLFIWVHKARDISICSCAQEISDLYWRKKVTNKKSIGKELVIVSVSPNSTENVNIVCELEWCLSFRLQKKEGKKVNH